MSTQHTREPTWGIEETSHTLYVGPMRKDGSGKISVLICSFDVEDSKPEFIIAKQRAAQMMVDAHNATYAQGIDPAAVGEIKPRFRKHLDAAISLGELDKNTADYVFDILTAALAKGAKV